MVGHEGFGEARARLAGRRTADGNCRAKRHSIRGEGRLSERIGIKARGGRYAELRPKQVAETGLRRESFRDVFLQGLKPDVAGSGFIGPAKAVPLLQTCLRRVLPPLA
jgi:hypothetical protein